MFNIGDVVECMIDAPITKVGDVGVVVKVLSSMVRVKFHKMQRSYFISDEFKMPLSWLRLIQRGENNNVQLKIKDMYERQPYFLRHRSGQPS